MTTGVIFDIKKYAIHDGPGIRTTVFMKGCPLNCWWCHNPESQKVAPEEILVRRKVSKEDFVEKHELVGREITTIDLMKEIKKDLLFYDESGGGVTFSGGEPFMQLDFLLELLQQSKNIDIHTAIDTSGYTSFSNFEKVFDQTDLFLYDLKIMDEDEHIKYTGVSNKIILKNLQSLAAITSKFRIRIPLIPGVTDTRKNLERISKFLSELKNIPRIDVLPYNEICEGKYERFQQKYELGKLEVQSDAKLDDISRYLIDEGFKVKLRG
ncbi:MAG: glycyl-radical enzyme activating protein [Bacteroidetes bacterium]|nr:glycyl-radical enzyme activating protein [Bacteroidota bacterium]